MAALLQRMGHAGAAASTTLVNSISPTALSFVVASTAGWPTGAGGWPFVAVVDPALASEEKILCASITGTTVTVYSGGRGFDGTSATSHNAGAVVEHVLAAVEVDDANRHVYTPGDDDHLQYARTDGSRAITGPAVFLAGITDTGVLDQTGVTHLRGNTDVTGTLSATGAATLGAGLTVTGNESVSGTLTVAGATQVPSLAVTGLTGAATPSRYAGSTASGPPTTGTFNLGDYIVCADGTIQICTTAGTPGTWKPVSPRTFGAGAYRNAAWTTPTTFTTAFLFDTETYDPNNNYNPATGQYTCPVAGRYALHAQFLYQASNVNEWARVLAYRQGALIVNGPIFAAASTVAYFAGATLDGFVLCAAGDKLEYRFQASNAFPAATGASATFANFELLVAT
jgi:hypothetical protein